MARRRDSTAWLPCHARVPTLDGAHDGEGRRWFGRSILVLCNSSPQHTMAKPAARYLFFDTTQTRIALQLSSLADARASAAGQPERTPMTSMQHAAGWAMFSPSALVLVFVQVLSEGSARGQAMWHWTGPSDDDGIRVAAVLPEVLSPAS